MTHTALQQLGTPANLVRWGKCQPGMPGIAFNGPLGPHRPDPLSLRARAVRLAGSSSRGAGSGGLISPRLSSARLLPGGPPSRISKSLSGPNSDTSALAGRRRLGYPLGPYICRNGRAVSLGALSISDNIPYAHLGSHFCRDSIAGKALSHPTSDGGTPPVIANPA